MTLCKTYRKGKIENNINCNIEIRQKNEKNTCNKNKNMLTYNI